ncbi:MAG: cysteine synthase A [Candidatus Omnitrophica bacterium]|nr:cysteine synthase A [Candidatus Omnitrophota bacterium]
MAGLAQSRIASSVLELIGGTPMVRLNRLVESSRATIYAKLESSNPGGSVKDRIALAMVEDAESRGLLKPGSIIIEPTSGNTGIGLAMVGAVKGYHVILTMPETMSAERIAILKGYGADVVLTPAEEGMTGAVRKAEELVNQTPKAFMPQQFRNPANPEIHRRTTAQEIVQALPNGVEAFVAGVGTGGTITGVGEVLKRSYPRLRVIGVEPKGSPVLSGGEPGPHLIQGIGAGFIPPVLNRAVLDEIVTITDEEAYETAKRLGREEGLLVGLSSGAACAAALQIARRLGPGQTLVVMFPDSGERYFSAEGYFQSRH